MTKDVYFDFKHTKFVNHDVEIILGKKEALLLKLLFVKCHHVVSSHEIEYYVYQDEMASEERIRSLVRQLRAKIPHDLIETIKGQGYRIANVKPEEDLLTKSKDLSLSCGGMIPFLSTLMDYGSVLV